MQPFRDGYAFSSSSVRILLFIGRRHHVRDKREDRHECKQNKAQRRSQRIQPVLYRQVIHPVDEKIRAVRVEISRRIDRFGAQEVEDTEVIELVDEGADDDGCRSEQHERKSEVPELFKCIRAVQFCRLVHVFICVGKDPRRQKHDGRNADPRATEEPQQPQRPNRVKRDDGEILRNPTPVFQHSQNRPAVAEQEVKTRQRNETGDGVGEHREDAPKTFPLQTLCVVQECKAQSAEIHQKGRADRPQDVPSENLAHRVDVFAHGEDDTETLKPRPTYQLRRNDLTPIVSERDERRKDDGHDIENTDEKQGQRERKKIEFLVKQRLAAFEKRFDAVALPDLARRVDRVLDIRIIGERKEEDKKDRRDPPCEHGNGIVPFDAHDGHALRRTERKEPDDVLDAREYEEEDKPDLQQHQEGAFGELHAKKLPQPHKRTAQLHPPVGKNALARCFLYRFHRTLLYEMSPTAIAERMSLTSLSSAPFNASAVV